MNPILILAALLAASIVVDLLVRAGARDTVRSRSIAGMALHGLLMLAGCGLFLTISGHLLVSALLSLALMTTLVLASNAKNTILGEPMVFSDLALIGAVFRHPHFYLSALRRWQIVLLVSAALVLLALQAWLFVPVAEQHLAGLALLVGSLALLWLMLQLPPWARLAPIADPFADVARHGLLATLLLHGKRWRQEADPPPHAMPVPATVGAELLVVVQCESFTDPADLFGDPTLALQGLAAARSQAWQWGQLMVSGFGAYTMRTEYGVIFGRSEAELGFRRFDPYLTALGEASHAIPARLQMAGWRSLFVHPHDLRFYGRHRIMPAAGFAELIGEAQFDPPGAGEGRYVTDAAMTERILELAGAASQPTLIYAVTIENHGPWPPDLGTDGKRQSSAYLRLAQNSDAMLTALANRLGKLGRPAMFVFFGDHRPSIPGLSMPGGDRHTPYVIMRFDAEGQPIAGTGAQRDISPAELNGSILAALAG